MHTKGKAWERGYMLSINTECLLLSKPPWDSLIILRVDESRSSPICISVGPILEVISTSQDTYSSAYLAIQHCLQVKSMTLYTYMYMLSVQRV